MSPDFNNTFITFILCYSEINEDTSGGRSLNLNVTDEILRTFRTLVLVNFNFGSQSWGDHTDSDSFCILEGWAWQVLACWYIRSWNVCRVECKK